MILSTWNFEYALQLKYENGMFLLCETSSAFIDAFCYSKIHFNQSGPFKLIKDLNSTEPKRGSVFIGLMIPDGAIWSRHQRAVLMR